MKKFAFILMGRHYDPERHQAEFGTCNQRTYIRTVRNLEEAFGLSDWLLREKVGAAELCGAFGRENALELIRRTHGEIAIGYVVHDAGQNMLFDQFFSDFS